jgi:cobalt-zinc-cadmium efflux system protein
MWVALMGVVINFISALFFKKNQKSDLNIKAAYWHLMADALVSFGVVISGILIHFFHWYALDGIAALVIAVVVLFSTWQLFKDSAIAILDGVPASVNQDNLKLNLMRINRITDIHHIHIWGLSTNENALTAHIMVETFEILPKVKKELKIKLESFNIYHSTLEFELSTEECDERMQ